MDKIEETKIIKIGKKFITICTILMIISVIALIYAIYDTLEKDDTQTIYSACSVGCYYMQNISASGFDWTINQSNDFNKCNTQCLDNARNISIDLKEIAKVSK